MGYSTQFDGKIQISPEPTASVLVFIKNYYDETEDRLDMELTNDMMSIEHNGMEKSRLDENMMQDFIDACVEEFPDIVFNGTLKASGEEYDDRWLLEVVRNVATRDDIIMTGTKVTCPHCDEDFKVELDEK